MKCQNCLVREGTENWVGQGSSMDFVHGNYKMWCKLCCYKAQLENARQQRDKIPQLEELVREEMNK